MSEFAGHLLLRAAPRHGDGRTTLARQSFRAPFHLSKPYWDADAGTLLVQIVNPTAGILSGDRLESDIAVAAEATLMVTTPSASRIFKMDAGSAECRQRFAVGAGGWLEVAPEPLVPHRGCRYRQVTRVEVEPGGRLFFVDQLMPGRTGHGEAWSWQRVSLELEVELGGELILRERFDHSGAELRALAELAGSGPTACFANALLIASDMEATPWLPQIGALHRENVWCGVSALRRGGWSIKIVAPGPVPLRETLRALRQILAPYFPRLACDPRKL
jgi:urease accessory protein